MSVEAIYPGGENKNVSYAARCIHHKQPPMFIPTGTYNTRWDMTVVCMSVSGESIRKELVSYNDSL